MFSLFILLIIKTLLNKTIGESVCSQNNNTCPQHVPFCAAGRCVYQCASSSFINGSNCVDSCADWYVNNSRCVEHCPENFTFVHQVPLSALTIARYCFAVCPYFTYSDGSVCLERCPVSRPFVENGTCVANCSDTLKYRYPVLDQNQQIQVNGTIQCVDKCPDSDDFVPGMDKLLIYGSRYLLNNTCVKSCGFLYESNGICVEQCPNNTKTIVALQVKYSSINSIATSNGKEYSSSPGKHVVCDGKCPDGMFIQERICVHSCAPGFKETFIDMSTPFRLPYMYARVCTSTCPSDQPYEHQGRCVPKCDIFTNGTKCVSNCGWNRFVYDDTCVDQCPENNSFVMNITKRYHSYHGRYYTYFPVNITFPVCIESCPSGSIIVSSKYCVSRCPQGTAYFNHTCVLECPAPYNYTKTTKSESRCVESCPAKYYYNNTTCYEKCPQTLHVLNHSCVAECPDTQKYIMTIVRKDDPFSCVRECPKDTFYKGNHCVDRCDLVYNNTCVNVCPPTAPLMHELVDWFYYNRNQKRARCKSECWGHLFKNGTECVRSCLNKFVYNGTCVDACPPDSNLTFEESPDNTRCLNVCSNYLYPNYLLKDGTKCVHYCPNKFVYNGTCVAVCPSSSNLTFDDPFFLNRTHCLNVCSNTTFREGFRCVPKCSDGMVVSDGSCVPVCPESQSFTTTILYKTQQTECVTRCPKNTFIDGNVCVQRCKSGMVISSKTCVKYCPKHQPYINRLNARQTCVETCPDGKLVHKNGTCIQSDDCPGFQYQGHCLTSCPDGFIQTSEDQNFSLYDNLKCESLQPVKIVLSVCSVTLIVWSACWCAFFSMREGVVNSFMFWKQREESDVYEGKRDGGVQLKQSDDETDVILDNIEINEIHGALENSHLSEETEV